MPVLYDSLIATVILLAFELGVSNLSHSSADSVEECGAHSKWNKEVAACSLKENTEPDPSCQREIQQEAVSSVSMTTSLALVPFDESRVLPHEKAVREFALAGHVFTIKQDWNTLGVAAVVWDSAVVLAEYLVENQVLVKGKNVLELGAGTGLTGMVAAALGGHVTVTEREEAMTHLKTTIEHNSADKSWEISATKLDWTHPVDDSYFPAPDVIIGADVIYIEETFQDLLRTILSLAKSSGTRVFLSCKIRYDRDLRFLNLLRDHFEVNEVFYDKDRDIKIFSVIRFS